MPEAKRERRQEREKLREIDGKREREAKRAAVLRQGKLALQPPPEATIQGWLKLLVN